MPKANWSFIDKSLSHEVVSQHSWIWKTHICQRILIHFITNEWKANYDDSVFVFRKWFRTLNGFFAIVVCTNCNKAKSIYSIGLEHVEKTQVELAKKTLLSRTKANRTDMLSFKPFVRFSFSHWRDTFILFFIHWMTSFRFFSIALLFFIGYDVHLTCSFSLSVTLCRYFSSVSECVYVCLSLIKYSGRYSHSMRSLSILLTIWLHLKSRN